MSGKGGLMRWQADCGHWMVVHSLEPTPALCPDCADKGRDALAVALKYWVEELRNAVSAAEDCVIGDVDRWASENGLTLSGDQAQQLQNIGDRCENAEIYLKEAHRGLREFLAGIPPKAPRLSMPEAG